MNWKNKETGDIVWAMQNTEENRDDIGEKLVNDGYKVSRNTQTNTISIWGGGLTETVVVYASNYLFIGDHGVDHMLPEYFEEQYEKIPAAEAEAPEQMTEEEARDLLEDNVVPLENSNLIPLGVEPTVLSKKDRALAEIKVAHLQSYLLVTEINEADNALTMCIMDDGSLVVRYKPKENTDVKIRDFIADKFIRVKE